MRQERGLSTLRSSTATPVLRSSTATEDGEDGQAASPSALADRKGIWQGPLDCPTRKRRKRRAPLACATATLTVGQVPQAAALTQARAHGNFPRPTAAADTLWSGTLRAPVAKT